MKMSRTMTDMEEEAGLGGDEDSTIAEYIQEVGDKTFILKDDVWTDTEYDENESYDWIEIEFLSDEYFDLIGDDEELATYFSVGELVIVIYDDVAYRITSE